MKIVLLGASQLALPIAWGVGQSELATEITFVSGAIMPGSTYTRQNGPTVKNVQELIAANAIGASDTLLSFASTTDGFKGADIIVLLPLIGTYPLQVSKTRSIAFARQFLMGIQQHAPEAKILVALSPANYLAAWVQQAIGTAQKRVIGLPNPTRTANLISQITKKLNLSVKDVTALAIGNDREMYPLPQYCRVNGIPVSELLPDIDVQTLSEAAPLATTGEYTWTSYLLQVISAISLDKKRVMSVGTYLATGKTAVYLNVPAKIGSDGVEGIVPLSLTEEQHHVFKQLVAGSAEEQIFIYRNDKDYLM